MQYLDLTLRTPAENLALDEALLEWAEEEHSDGEFLRIWESPQPIVVVGRSSRVRTEVDEAACRQRGIPILRRSSGGAAIVTGPGCLMYAVVLSLHVRPELKDIGRAHAFILARLATSLGPLLAGSGIIKREGTSDLVLNNAPSPCPLPGGEGIAPSPWALPEGEGSKTAFRKFSGNSLRVKRTHLLYHGTLLYDFDLSLIETCLRTPPRQPEYRNARAHCDFVMNLPATRQQLVDAVRGAWPIECKLANIPMTRVERLVAERFGNDGWNYEFA